jgi:hypothetical protein
MVQHLTIEFLKRYEFVEMVEEDVVSIELTRL